MSLSLNKKGNLKVDDVPITGYPLDFIADLVQKKLPDPVSRSRNITKPGDLLILIRAGTAAGKSSLIPKVLYEKIYGSVGRNIIVSEPRVITAESIPKEICKHSRDATSGARFEIGINIGYKTGTFKGHVNVKGILFITTGILILMLQGGFEKFMQRCSVLIVDEIHEQDSNLVLSLILIKRLLNEHYRDPRCPVIIFMSATFDPELYIKHYGVPSSNFLEVAGLQSFPIQDIFTPYTITDFLGYAADKAIETHLENLDDYKSGFQDIIIFVKSAYEIRVIESRLMSFNMQVYKGADVTPYLTNTKSEKYQHKPKPKSDEKTGGGKSDSSSGTTLDKKKPYLKVIKFSRDVFTEKENVLHLINRPIREVEESLFEETVQVKPFRRVIITTPIIETGFTSREAKYIIDTGFSKQVIFNPELNMSYEYGGNVNKNTAIQRRGRAGRRAPGVFMACYTQKTFEDLPAQNYSRFLYEDLTDSVLGIIIKESESRIATKSGYSMDDRQIDHERKHIDFSKLEFIEYPSSDSLCLAFEKLFILGFITDTGLPTPLGAFAYRIKKISAECRKMIMSGYAHGAYIYDLITIACFISLGVFPNRKFDPYINGENYWFDDNIDLLLFWYKFTEKVEQLFDNSDQPESLDQSILESKLDVITDWCSERGFDYKALLKVAVLKTEIILDMVRMQFDVFYNSLNIDKGSYSLMDFVLHDKKTAISEFRKIKLCVYDGFKMNLVTLIDSKSDTGSKREHRTNYKNQSIKLSGTVSGLLFKAGYWIRHAVAVSMKSMETPMGQSRIGSQLSILDGFFNPDLTFIAS